MKPRRPRSSGPARPASIATSVEENADEPCPFARSLLVATHAVEARLEAVLVPLDLSLAKFSVLRHLAQAGEALALGALAQRSACVRSNMTQLADRLELDGLIRRIDDPADRRSVKAVLTPEGRIRFRSASAALAEQEARMVAGFAEAERATLAALLERLSGGVPPA